MDTYELLSDFFFNKLLAAVINFQEIREFESKIHKLEITDTIDLSWKIWNTNRYYTSLTTTAKVDSYDKNEKLKEMKTPLINKDVQPQFLYHETSPPALVAVGLCFTRYLVQI